MSITAIIPARGNSKGILKKNLCELGNHPLIAWSIKVALQCDIVDRCIVSTDCDEIASISKDYGAEVPFIRPSIYAKDDTPDKPVFVHSLKWLRDNESYQPNYVFHLRPTTPFRTSDDLKDASNIFFNSDCESIRSVSLVEANAHPYWVYKNDLGWAKPFNDDPKTVSLYPNRQSLPPVYKPQGLIDGYTPISIYNYPDMHGPKTKLLITRDTIDIDTYEDLEYANFLLKAGKIENIFQKLK